jgi:crotonobetainyl-CoA:carnitine CoA-transferase CaiB-like acyl-CoA transferase
VYCSISGFGATGPRRNTPGYDAVVQAEGGLMSLTGPGDGDPYRLGVAIADIVAGMFAAQGITLALLVRERTGKGQLVDVAMLDSVASLLTYQAGIYFATGRTPTRMGNRHPSIAPYDTVVAEDGTLVLAVGNDEQWRTFCGCTGLSPLSDDARFATNAARVQHYDELRPLIARAMRTRSRQEWIDRLVPAGVSCAAVRGLDEVLTDPQLVARDMIETVHHPTAGRLNVLGVPIKLSETPGTVVDPPPRLGEDTTAVLERMLGVSRDDIARLHRDAVIGVASPLGP